MSGAFDPQYDQQQQRVFTCGYSLGHRNRHQCDCVCVRLKGHDRPHQCSAMYVAQDGAIFDPVRP